MFSVAHWRYKHGCCVFCGDLDAHGGLGWKTKVEVRSDLEGQRFRRLIAPTALVTEPMLPFLRQMANCIPP